MKKYIKQSLALVLVLGLYLSNLGGVVISSSVEPGIYRIMPPIGQKHSYSVFFRGNGEAITYAKIVIPNREEQALSEFSFEIPEVDTYEMTMYQIQLPKECVRYDDDYYYDDDDDDYYDDYYYDDDDDDYYDDDYYDDDDDYYYDDDDYYYDDDDDYYYDYYDDPNNPCIEYLDPDYGQDYDYYGGSQQAEYTKIKYTQIDNTYRLTLPNPIEPSQSTAIIISYATKGYVNNNFGLYEFNFETIKVASRIQDIRVAIDVDSDLLLKGKQSSVNYDEGYGVIPMAQLGDARAVSSGELDRVVSSIGISGALIKESKSLAPNESFNVRGEYAENWLRLYLNEIIIAILVIIVIIVLIYFISKYIKSKPKNISVGSSNTQDKTSNIVNKNSINLFNLTNVLVSLGSVIMLMIISMIISLLDQYDSWILYDTPFSSLISVITNLLYAFILLAPATMVGLKRGWGNALSVIILQFIWSIIILILYPLLFQSGLNEVMLYYR